jgi:hypothetical protein
MGGSFGFGNDDSDGQSTVNKYASAEWLHIGSRNQYIDSYFKLDYPE